MKEHEASTLVEFRKRFSEEDMAAILEASIPRPEKSRNYEDSDDPPNGGALALDAACCPADIAYPQDVNLLNQAREKLEQMVDEICKSAGEKKPRTYRKRARRDVGYIVRFVQNGVKLTETQKI